MTRAELVVAVRDHAMKHYEESGWDYVVECYTDADIINAIGDATTVALAVERVGSIVRILDERRRAVMAEVF